LACVDDRFVRLNIRLRISIRHVRTLASVPINLNENFDEVRSIG